MGPEANNIAPGQVRYKPKCNKRGGVFFLLPSQWFELKTWLFYNVWNGNFHNIYLPIPMNPPHCSNTADKIASNASAAFWWFDREFHYLMNFNLKLFHHFETIFLLQDTSDNIWNTSWLVSSLPFCFVFACYCHWWGFKNGPLICSVFTQGIITPWI